MHHLGFGQPSPPGAYAKCECITDAPAMAAVVVIKTCRQLMFISSSFRFAAATASDNSD